jgi:uncharacterized protein (DUF1330 family)
MKAYAIFGETIQDQATFDEYRKHVLPTLVQYKGQFVVRGGSFTVLEGDWPHQRFVIIEFPSRADAEGWYHSPEYQRIVGLRLKSSKGSAIIIDGAP